MIRLIHIPPQTLPGGIALAMKCPKIFVEGYVTSCNTHVTLLTNHG